MYFSVGGGLDLGADLVQEQSLTHAGLGLGAKGRFSAFCLVPGEALIWGLIQCKVAKRRPIFSA